MLRKTFEEIGFINIEDELQLVVSLRSDNKYVIAKRVPAAKQYIYLKNTIELDKENIEGLIKILKEIE